MKRHVFLLVGLLAFIPILAQQSDYYYYYKGNRIDLEVDSTRLCVVSEGGLQLQNSINTRIENYSISSSFPSYIYSNVVPLQKERATLAFSKVYSSTLDISGSLNPMQYNDVVEKVKSEDNVWQVLPSFTVDGRRVDVSNNFYVRLKSSDDFGKLQQMAAQYGIEVIGYNEFMPLWYTLSCNAASLKNAIEAANLFQESLQFACSEPELYNYKLTCSSDEHYSEQWNLKNTGLVYGIEGIDINVEEAWEITKGEGVVVAVLDDGIDITHRDLYDNIYPESYDVMTNSSPSQLYDYHGTACAGIIGAVQDNVIGISGVAPECKLMPISFDACVTSMQLANGISWARRKGADVISNSWGGLARANCIDEAIDSALYLGRNKKGCVVVFSSGNDGDRVSYPARSNPKVLTVGGITPYGRRATSGWMENNHYVFFSSNYGEELDVVAPSELIYTTNYPYGSGLSNTDYYGDFDGTSAACPHVAGVAALILSIYPDLTTEQVADIIEYTSKKIRPDLYTYQFDSIHPHGTWNEEMGYGLIDAGAAVKLADKALRTTYVRDTILTNGQFKDYDVEFENVIIEPDAFVEVDKYNSVILKSSVFVRKGGKFIIYKEPLE